MNWTIVFLLVFISLILNFIRSLTFISKIKGKKTSLRRIQVNFIPLVKLLFKIGIRPYFLTILNSVSGIISFYFLMKMQFLPFVLFFLLSIFMDSLDGLMARTVKKTSKLWGKLDLLIDGTIRFLILLGFWFIYPSSTIGYGILFFLGFVIIFVINQITKIKQALDFRPFIEFFIILAIFLPDESLTALTFCMGLNFILFSSCTLIKLIFET